MMMTCKPNSEKGRKRDLRLINLLTAPPPLHHPPWGSLGLLEPFGTPLWICSRCIGRLAAW